MTPFPKCWAPLLDGPLFAFTADQDWAPEWAVDFFLDELRRVRIPLHIFRTNPSAAIDRAVSAGEVEQGWHPNFLPGSSHGTTVSEVIGYCKRNFPGASTVRSHCFAENTFAWRDLREAGIVADSQLATFFQGYLLPVVHWSGIMRFPIYFEDDIFLDVQAPDLNLETVMPTLFTPGLKILNFHPTFVGCNTPSRSYHEQLKVKIFDPDSTRPELTWGGRGTFTVFRELIERILSHGYHFQPFQSLVDLTRESLLRSGDVFSPCLKDVLLNVKPYPEYPAASVIGPLNAQELKSRP